jgi:hydroxymethylpyrimidine pyrophosphatase-like HAD family hydrolase
MILAVDFDGTLYDGDQVNYKLINRLKKNQKQGDIVILWTCRDGKRLTEALNILAKSGFKPNLVNQNAPQAIQSLGYDPRKILADIYIDDKAISIN